jgi:hypothetical protein
MLKKLAVACVLTIAYVALGRYARHRNLPLK